MSERVFIFYDLKPEVDRQRFEQRAREVEAPLAASFEAIERYALTRFEVDSGEERPFEYVEVLDVTSVEAYRTEVCGPDVDAFLAAWEADVSRSVMVFGTLVSGTER